MKTLTIFKIKKKCFLGKKCCDFQYLYLSYVKTSFSFFSIPIKISGKEREKNGVFNFYKQALLNNSLYNPVLFFTSCRLVSGLRMLLVMVGAFPLSI